VPMNDGAAPDQPVPLFLTDRGVVAEQFGSSRILKTALVVLTVSALGAAVFAFGEPVTRLAAVTASLVDASPAQPDSSQPALTVQSPGESQPSPAMQSTADVQAQAAAVPDSARQETAQDAAQPTRQEPRQDSPQVAAAAAVQLPTAQPQTDAGERSSDALFRQFQTWSREQESRQGAQAPQVPSAQAQAAQDAPAKVESDARAPVRTVKKRRHVRAIQNARAEMRSARNNRAKLLRARNATPARARSVENAQAQEVAAQNAQPPQQPPRSQSPSFFQALGWQ
jgi:hypothetical protein